MTALGRVNKTKDLVQKGINNNTYGASGINSKQLWLPIGIERL